MSSLNWDLVVSLAPIVILIYMMTKKMGIPSYVALPVTALLVYLIKLVYFNADPNLINATVVNGLLTVGGDQAMTITIGEAFARAFEGSWQLLASYLGALGAFFSGSNTVSNLTFAGIQLSIAQTLGLDTSRILAMQSVGGAMGNMVCINNIVAVCSILGIVNKEGFILKKTVLPMLLYGIVVGIVGLFLG